MKKIKSALDKKLLISFFIKSIFFSAVFCALISAIIAFIILQLDVSHDSAVYFSVAIAAISAGATAYICASSFKNSGYLIGVISALPLILFSFINMLVNHNIVWIFLLKTALVIISAGIMGALTVKNSKKIRVKK